MRNGLNLDGTFRRLTPFGTPLDPAALVAASARGGGGLAAALAATQPPPLPQYRFKYIVGVLNRALGDLKSMSSLILKGIEQRDNSRLLPLRNEFDNVSFVRLSWISDRHPLIHLQLSNELTLKFAVDEARQAIAVIDSDIGTAIWRRDHWTGEAETLINHTHQKNLAG